MTWIKATGRIKYDPDRVGLKRRNGPGWVVVEMSNGICWFYKWLLERRGIELNKQAWQAHITVCSGEPLDPKKVAKFWKKYDGVPIEFEYSTEIYSYWKFYALRVRSKMLSELRSELGLSADYPFHVTIGRIKE